jgi:hypothetical protein
MNESLSSLPIRAGWDGPGEKRARTWPLSGDPRGPEGEAAEHGRPLRPRLSGAPAEAGLQGSGVPLASHGAAAMSRPETNLAEAEAEISEASSEEEGAEESKGEMESQERARLQAAVGERLAALNASLAAALSDEGLPLPGEEEGAVEEGAAPGALRDARCDEDGEGGDGAGDGDGAGFGLGGRAWREESSDPALDDPGLSAVGDRDFLAGLHAALAGPACGAGAEAREGGGASYVAEDWERALDRTARTHAPRLLGHAPPPAGPEPRWRAAVSRSSQRVYWTRVDARGSGHASWRAPPPENYTADERAVDRSLRAQLRTLAASVAQLEAGREGQEEADDGAAAPGPEGAPRLRAASLAGGSAALRTALDLADRLGQRSARRPVPVAERPPRRRGL